MAIDPTTASAAEIARAVSAGEVSAAEVIEQTLLAIRMRDPILNCFTAVTAERAAARARAIDRDRCSHKPLGPLAGVPFAVKNLFDVAGLPTLAGSKINRSRAPATRDAVLIERLEAAGAILVGALNMGEYAYDFTGENVHAGPSRNPHDASRMTGGSSGGSAGAVAGRLVPLALASDTNGSIRVPASFCGLFGLKPTYGRLSAHAHVSVRGEPRSSRSARAPRRISRSPTMPCRAPIREDAGARARRRAGDAADRARASSGLRIAVAGGYFAPAPAPRPSRRSMAWRRRSAPTGTSSCRRPRGRGRPPM